MVGFHKELHTHNRDSNDAIIKEFYIKYCKMIIKVTQEAKRQHDRLIAKSQNINNMEYNENEIGKRHVTEQLYCLLITKTENPEKVADVVSSFFLSIAEQLNLNQVGKEELV
jgi:hypothetical protein